MAYTFVKTHRNRHLKLMRLKRIRVLGSNPSSAISELRDYNRSLN